MKTKQIRRLILSVTGLLLTFTIPHMWIVNAQTLNVKYGKSISHLSSYFDYKNEVNTALFVGMDFMNKTYFDISSEIGYIKKGGETVQMTDMGGQHYFDGVDLTLKTMEINSVFRYKPVRFNKLFLYCGIGPKLDILLSDEYNYELPEYLKQERFRKYTYGIIMSAGTCYDSKKQDSDCRTLILLI